MSNMSIRKYSGRSSERSSIVDTASYIDEGKLDTIAKLSMNDLRSESLSILIISTERFCEKLKRVMSEISNVKYGGNIKIKLALNIEQILNSGLKSSSIDYVAIVCDTTVWNSDDQVTSNIPHLKSMAATRLCLVNGSPKTGIKGSAYELVKLAETYNLLYINGEILEDRGCKRIAERIMGLAATSCGYHTGIPFVIPTAMDIYKQLIHQ